MKKSIKQTIAIIVLTVVLGFTNSLFAQNAVQDSKGNYTALTRAQADSSTATKTGKTFTDGKGIVFPVFQTIKGKLFVRKTSKTGNAYNMYLKL